MANNDSILALINLIDDPDESIYEHVHDRLLSYEQKKKEKITEK